ncbi:MAG: two pore domain potassium channel family protein [Corynebacteriales bacterium]|nr:two pore domain potassium channel family protein [Mycobacteriales bacterium]
MFRIVWRNPASRAACITGMVLTGIATAFYATVEEWSLIDSAFFAIITGLTISYEGLAPSSPLSKVFTAFYALFSVGLFITLAATFASTLIAENRRRRERKHKSDLHMKSGGGRLGHPHFY